MRPTARFSLRKYVCKPSALNRILPCEGVAMRSGIAPKNRLINPRRRPVIPSWLGLLLRPLLQFPCLLPLFPHLPLLLLALGLVAAGLHRGQACCSIRASLAWASALTARSVRAPAQCPSNSAAVSARSMTAAGARPGRLARNW